MKSLKFGINLFCYVFTASILLYALTIWTVVALDTSPPGLQLHECLQLSDTLAPDHDTTRMIQKGCLGNYIIHS